MLRLLFVEDDIAVTQSKMTGLVSEFSILDLNLNDENRAELSPGVLIINHDAKVVVVASYGNLRTASQPMRHGATDVIAVPLTIEEIDYALNRPGSPAMPVPEDITPPDKAGDTHTGRDLREERMECFTDRACASDAPPLTAAVSGKVENCGLS
jgi:ActR/RegA family two-component response regulator